MVRVYNYEQIASEKKHPVGYFPHDNDRILEKYNFLTAIFPSSCLVV